jgi:hypothetical protein
MTRLSRGRWAAAAALFLALGGALAAGCNGDPKASPMATPSLTITPSRAPLGYPLEMTYKFVVAPDAKFTKDYRVMVHFISQDDAVL